MARPFTKELFEGSQLTFNGEIGDWFLVKTAISLEAKTETVLHASVRADTTLPTGRRKVFTELQVIPSRKGNTISVGPCSVAIQKQGETTTHEGHIQYAEEMDGWFVIELEFWIDGS